MTGRRWIPLAAVAALLGIAMLAAVYANPTIESIPPELIGTQPPRAATAATEAPAEQPTRSPLPRSEQVLPVWVGWLITGLCVAAILAVVAAMVWTILRDRLLERKAPLVTDHSATPTPAQTQERLRAAVDEGLLDLDDDDADPRRAVIACWVRLEEAAAAAGTPRSPGDTSTELVGRLLAAHHISAPVLDGFAAIYREARFASHAVDAAMRDQARTSLRRLRDELSTGSFAASASERGADQARRAERADGSSAGVSAA